MAQKIHSVRWEDGDGEQGYFVKLSRAQAVELDAFLKEEEAKGVIKDPSVGAIEGEWLLSIKQFHHEFKERYRSP